jgi:hypothetical protein
MEMVGAVGSGHEALEADKAVRPRLNTLRVSLKRRKGARAKPSLFLKGLHTSADKSSVKVAGAEGGIRLQECQKRRLKGVGDAD